MREYLKALNHVLKTGKRKFNRTGVDTFAVFGYQMRFDLTHDGFPLLTTKKMFWKGIVHELLWMIQGGDDAGYMNVRELEQQGVNIWSAWSDPDGNLGPTYGGLWRHWPDPFNFSTRNGYDQLAEAIKDIRTNPTSRRIIVSAWNPSLLSEQRLPPCHLFYQFIVDDDYIHCHMLMRSADIFLGVPFNIASYALLTGMIAHCTNHKVGELVISFTDLHLYENHINQAMEQLNRGPLDLPRVGFDLSVQEIDDFKYEHIQLVGYQHHPAIKAEVAV
jgi:thymidylate synthase